MVVDAPEMVAIRHGGEGAVERQNLQAMPWQVEIADDFGPQQGNHVRAHGKLEAGKDLFGDSCAAKHMTTLEDEHFLPSTGQVCGIDQTVVAAADYDGVISS